MHTDTEIRQILTEATNMENEGRGWQACEKHTDTLVQEMRNIDSLISTATIVSELRESLGQDVLASMIHSLAEHDNETAAWTVVQGFGRIMRDIRWDGVGALADAGERGAVDYDTRLPGMMNTAYIAATEWTETTIIAVINKSFSCDIWSRRAAFHLIKLWTQMNHFIPVEIRQLVAERDLYADHACHNILVDLQRYLQWRDSQP